jgi:uncharacterized protein (TIGR04206 family)
MARWVIDEYENPLAAVFVAVSLLVPWSVSRLVVQGGATVLTYVRWPFVQWRRLASGGGAETSWMTPLDAYRFQTGANGPTPLADAYAVWGVAALLFGLTFLFTLALLADEERVEGATRRHLHRRPALVLGWLLVASGIVYLAATAGVFFLGAAGLTLPVGSLFMLLFGALLLTNDG